MKSSPTSRAGDGGNRRLLDVRQQAMKDAMGSSGTYTGQIDVDIDLPEGHGEMQYVDAPDEDSSGQPNHAQHSTTSQPSLVASYKGNWREGHWHGQGVQKLLNGDVFLGEFDRSVRIFGEYRWKDEEQQKSTPTANGHQQETYLLRKQRSYQGAFHENGRPHGHGKYTWSTTKVLPSSSSSPTPPSVSTYVGMFDNGQRHGHGVYTSSVLQYTGEWEQGKYHGYGVLKVPKKTYRGQFHFGKKEGKGQEVMNDDGTVLHEGMWTQDRPVMVVEESLPAQPLDQQPASRPVSTLFQTPQEIVDGEGIHGMYKGIVEALLPSGVGTITYDDHPSAIIEYEGFFDQKGRRHGYGRATFQNGDRYQGNWNDGVFEGTGEYTFCDGRLYKGEWLNGLPHGPDEKFIWPNNDLFQGVYDNGRRKKGRLVFSDGGYYDGEFFSPDGNYGGKGKLVTLLISFEGGFRDGAFHGPGCLRNNSGVVIFDGDWRDGQPARDDILVAIPEDFLEIPHPPEDDDFGAFEDTLTQETSGLLSTLKRTISPMPRDMRCGSDPSTIGASDRNSQSSSRPSIFDSLETIALGFSSAITSDKSSSNSTPSAEETCKAVVDMAVSDAQENPGRFTGIIHVESQRPHGVGRMVYQDGNRIHEGFWVNGNRDGYGRCLFSQIGDYHEGEYRQNLRHGPGKYYWKDGRKFIGNYERDERSGDGKFVYPNGDLYVGNFKNGCRSGFGVFDFCNKTCQYRGEWTNSMYNGFGRLQWKGEDGIHVYEGEFSEGHFHGEGVETVNQTVKRRGWWDNGSYSGDSHPGASVNEVNNGEASHETNESVTSADECPTTLEQNYEDHRLQWKRSLEPTGV